MNDLTESWLGHYLQAYLWVDADWVGDLQDMSATYWQARLAQTTTAESLPDGRVKWRVRTRIVDQVAEPEKAALLCLTLNRFAAGWSFACDSEERTIDALVAICAPPAWDTYLLRLSEKSMFSAWMSDVVAERLADAVGGIPALSHPSHQPSVREEFDTTYYYLEALRSRPEWVLDSTRAVFPPLPDIARVVAENVGAEPSHVDISENEFHIFVGRTVASEPVWLTGRFDDHPIFGNCWASSVQVPLESVTPAIAAQVSAMTWALFDDADTNLLGGWTYDSGCLEFQQWNTMTEVRKQEALRSFDGHGPADLWGFTSTLSEIAGSVAQANLTTDPGAGAPAIRDVAEHVIGAIGEQARPAISQPPQEDDDKADRRLLWLDRKQIVAVAAWFNPMGPTVASLEVCSLPDSTEYLVYFMRHPFSSRYLVVGRIEPGAELAAIQTAGTNMLIDASLPNVLVQWNNPGVEAADVPDILRDRVLQVATENDYDLVAQAAWIAHTMGRPWDFAPPDPSVQDRFLSSVRDSAESRPDGGFADWWEQVSKTENVLANFRYLPDAWDGALNFQTAHGNLGWFDVGKFVLVHSTIGSSN